MATEYLLSVYMVDGEPMPTAEEMEAMNKDIDVFNARLKASGAWVFAGGLHPRSSATTVRVDGADVLTTDGPFAEGKEYIGGFWIVNADDLDAALALAEGGSRACRRPIEVRPFEQAPAD
ncbi:MAG TPA: YciI family protein [Candidatus Dormibacteraeota bacterium]|nr:YciI family protein [Candidatus Dormibacteraeota bacterium]